jgi:DNA-binding MarR family transcriptional regulator
MTERSNQQQAVDLAESVALLVRRVRAAAADHELSLTERSVLGRLNRDGAMTTADLARAESVRPQSMGATVAGLQTQGLVRRRKHPTDGRQWLVELTAKGSAVRKEIRSAKESWFTQTVAELSPSEQKTLFAASAILRRMAQL